MKEITVPFDVKKAKKGAEVLTRGGRPARIICYDAKLRYPIIALILAHNGWESFNYYTLRGTIRDDEKNDNDDLMIKEVEFEEGDIIAFGFNIQNLTIGILRVPYNNYHDDYFDTTSINSLNSYPNLYFNRTNSNLRLATEDEKQRLFKVMELKGIKWNSEKKCIEEISVKKEFNKGDIVLVKAAKDSIWDISIFIDYRYDLKNPYLTVKGSYAECISYENNKELYLTSKDLPVTTIKKKINYETRNKKNR